jgi:putative zinc finger/helix-turn-helix YgiT family protein
MNCPNCGESLKRSRISSYQYLESGLKNIFLKDIKSWNCTACGEVELEIPNLENLQTAIAKTVACQPEKLKPEEIRFLRVHLGLSAAAFSKVLSVEAETVSRWERGRMDMKLTNERFLRLLILSKLGPFREYGDLTAFGVRSNKHRLALNFKSQKDGWRQAS